jgi:hypothetical protein
MCRQESRSADWQHSWLVTNFSVAPVARPRNCTCFHATVSERIIGWNLKPEFYWMCEQESQVNFWIRWVLRVFDMKGCAFSDVWSVIWGRKYVIPGSFVNKSTRLKVLCSKLWKSRSTSCVWVCVCAEFCRVFAYECLWRGRKDQEL